MASIKKVIVEVDMQGNIFIEDDHGGATDLVSDLERHLGKVTSKNQTCAANPKTTQQKVQQKNG